MEEGLEPQELIEQTEKSHEVAHGEHEPTDPKVRHMTMRSAIIASILAVGAALSALLSGHAANEAILKTVEASDKWSEFQAKSTKGHIYEGNRLLLLALGAEKNPEQQKHLQDFESKLQKYASEKDDLQKQAEALSKHAEEEFAAHQKFSISVACLQIGIVLASVSILVRSKLLYYGSLTAGAIGVLCVVWGVINF